MGFGAGQMYLDYSPCIFPIRGSRDAEGPPRARCGAAAGSPRGRRSAAISDAMGQADRRRGAAEPPRCARLGRMRNRHEGPPWDRRRAACCGAAEAPPSGAAGPLPRAAVLTKSKKKYIHIYIYIREIERNSEIYMYRDIDIHVEKERERERERERATYIDTMIYIYIYIYLGPPRHGAAVRRPGGRRTAATSRRVFTKKQCI